MSAGLDLDVLGADVDRALDRFNTSLFDKDFNDMRKRCRGFTKEWRELSSPPNGVFPDSCAGWCRACGSSLVRGRIQRKPPCVLIVMYRPWIRSVDPRRVRISAWTAESSASISRQPTPASLPHSGEHSRRRTTLRASRISQTFFAVSAERAPLIPVAIRDPFVIRSDRDRG